MRPSYCNYYAADVLGDSDIPRGHTFSEMKISPIEIRTPKKPYL